MTLNPYLSFDGNCREAMSFYQDCLGGELSLQSFGESPLADQFPEEMHKRIIHSMLRSNNLVIMATDMQGPAGHVKGNDMSMLLNFDNEEDIRHYYFRLSEGGQILDELGEKFWGDLFGTVQDKFGKVWMMNCNKSNR